MPQSKKDLIKQAHKRFSQAEAAETKQRQREKDDLTFYNGEQWPEDIIQARKGQGLNNQYPPTPPRPTLTINLTREPVRQILNQERQSDLGVYLVPADDFGSSQEPVSEDEIKVREGLIRRIQRDSEAADARTWAFARATIAGRGYYGVMTRYVPGKTSDQEIYIQRFYNQFGVMLDPAHEQPDGADAEWGFVGTDMPWDQYKAEYPKRAKGEKNRIVNSSESEFRALGDEAPGWFFFATDDAGRESEMRMVRVVDYYYTERTSRQLAMFQDGRAEWVEDLPEGTDPESYETRTVVEKSIKWAKIDGCDDDVLDETDWPGRYIPIIKVLGEELQPADGERRCEGMVRPAKDSCRSFNYMVSKWVEQIGLAPIPPWIMPAGADRGFEAEWQASTTRTLPALHFNQTDIDGRPIVAPPQRTSITTDIQAIAASVALFKESITDTMGVPPPALGHVDPTLKSGKAIQAVLEQAQRGTSNYLDNLVRSMRHEGRIVNDLLYPIYGRPGRIARMMNPQGKMEVIQLGQAPGQPMQGPSPQGPQAPQMGQPQMGGMMGPQGPMNGQQPQGPQPPKVYTLTKDVEFNVAVKVSKNFDTQRQQQAATLGQLLSADPSLMAIIGDLFMENQDGPGTEEMAKRFKAVLDPRVMATLQGQAPPPPQLVAQLQQAQMAIQQLQPEADKNRADLMKAQMNEQAENQRKAAELQSKQAEMQAQERANALDNLVKLAIAEMSAQQRMAEIHAEQARTALGFAHEHAQNEMDRQSGAMESEKDRQSGAVESERERQFSGSEAERDRESAAMSAVEPT